MWRPIDGHNGRVVGRVTRIVLWGHDGGKLPRPTTKELASPPPVRVLMPSEGLPTAWNKFGLVDVECAFLDVDSLIPLELRFFLWRRVFNSSITRWVCQMAFPDFGDLCVSTVNDIAFFLQFVEDVVHILFYLLQPLVQHSPRLCIRCSVCLRKVYLSLYSVKTWLVGIYDLFSENIIKHELCFSCLTVCPHNDIRIIVIIQLIFFIVTATLHLEPF